MTSKPILLMVISALIVATIFSSYTFVAFAKTPTRTAVGVTTICSGDNKRQLCGAFGAGGVEGEWLCKYHKNTKTWSCVQEDKTGGSSNILAGISDALAKARAGATTGGGNNTNILEGNTVKGGRLLKGG